VRFRWYLIASTSVQFIFCSGASSDPAASPRQPLPVGGADEQLDRRIAMSDRLGHHQQLRLLDILSHRCDYHLKLLACTVRSFFKIIRPASTLLPAPRELHRPLDFLRRMPTIIDDSRAGIERQARGRYFADG
jgi:hypothetical protein